MKPTIYKTPNTNFELSNNVLFFLSKAILNYSQTPGSSITEDQKIEFIFIADLLSAVSESEPGELSDYIATTDYFINKSDDGSVKDKEICHLLFSLKRGEVAMLGSYMITNNANCIDAVKYLKEFFK